MPDGSIPCILGKMEEQLANIEERADSMCTKLERLDDRLRSVEDSMQLTKGGWAMLVAIGSIVAALGAFGNTLLQHFFEPAMKALKQMV